MQKSKVHKLYMQIHFISVHKYLWIRFGCHLQEIPEFSRVCWIPNIRSVYFIGLLCLYPYCRKNKEKAVELCSEILTS